MKIKKLLLLTGILCSALSFAQYTSGTVNLGSTGMTAKIDTNATTVTLTLTGNSNAMLAIGFGGTSMSSATDAFIYNSSSSRDYIISGQSTPDADSSQNWTETSNTVSGTTRTIVATRSLTGGGEGDYDFTNSSGSIPVIFAIKTGSTALQYHSSRGSTTLSRTLGTSELESKDSIVLYPNPADDYFTLSNYKEVSQINLVDTSGKIVAKNISVEEKIDINHLESGVYYLEIMLKNGTSDYKKIIKK